MMLKISIPKKIAIEKINNCLGPEEMAWSVKYLKHNHENMSLIPIAQIKSCTWWSIVVVL